MPTQRYNSVVFSLHSLFLIIGIGVIISWHEFCIVMSERKKGEGRENARVRSFSHTRNDKLWAKFI